MINLLIIEKNLIIAKNLVNYITPTFSDIRIFNIVSNSKSAIDIIKKDNIDLILLDSNLSDISEFKILEYLPATVLEKYKNSIIIIGGLYNNVKEVISNPYIFSYNYPDYNYNQILTDISKWKNTRTFNSQYLMARKKIIKELEFLKYNFSHIGTTYLLELILELYIQRKTTPSTNLTKTIYPSIAHKHNKSINNIKSNITQATLNMYYNCSEENLKIFFGYNSVIEKPRSKEIAFKILYKLL